MVVAGSVRLGQIMLAGASTWWLESRPDEGGRTVLVHRRPDGRCLDLTPPELNLRSRAHEYGGGACWIDGEDVFFVNYADQRLYRQDVAGAAPIALTPAADVCYADGMVDRRRDRVICVREDHRGEGEPTNAIVAIDLRQPDCGRPLVAGKDFFANPRLSPDGRRLAWVCWEHPSMPWDGSALMVGEVGEDGAVGATQCLAGGPDESVFQPEWAPDGSLCFVSDRSGWWNLYHWQPGNDPRPLWPAEAEFGLPQWVFGMSTYAFVGDSRLACVRRCQGIDRLAVLDLASGARQEVALPYTSVSSVHATAGRVVFCAAAATEPAAVVELDVETGETVVLRRSFEVAVDPRLFSVPQAVEFPTADGLTAHAFYYPPTNPEFAALPDERPPLLVKSHGGPTGAAENSLSLKLQYWTSRGVAVVDVDYGGSTGYGREYRQRLDRRWGVVDVEDCANAARYLVGEGRADAERLAISGGSAGGYTTLCALTFTDLFKAGASYYGICDLEVLVRDTHKFESRYLDRLLGPYPEQRDLYRERSPIHFAERLSCPVIFFQGLEDKVVPPNQAEMMVQALKAKGIPVAYLAFEGEQHGFRRAENIKRALEAELFFYSRVFGFTPADAIEPVPIANEDMKGPAS